MTIEKRTVDTATCDACGHIHYADQYGNFDDGYEFTVTEHQTGTQHDAWACKETHMGKAARAALARWRADRSWEDQPAQTEDTPAEVGQP